jgi:hypothetical protein
MHRMILRTAALWVAAIHLAAPPGFGDTGPGEGSTTVSRLHLARGTLGDFLKRLEADRRELAAREMTP